MGDSRTGLERLRRWAPPGSILFAWLFFLVYEALVLIAISIPHGPANAASYPQWWYAWLDVALLVALPIALGMTHSSAGLLASGGQALFFALLIHLAFKWSRRESAYGSTRRVGWVLAIWALASTALALRLGGLDFSAGVRAAIVSLVAVGWGVFGADAAASRLIVTDSRSFWIVLGIWGAFDLLIVLYGFFFMVLPLVRSL